MIRRMLILGTTGDLTPRYLLPALARLCEASKLPEGFRISGLARKEWDTEAFRTFAEERLAEHAGEVSAEAQHALVEVLGYHQADVTDPGRVKAALGDSLGPGGDSGRKDRLGSARHHDGSEDQDEYLKFSGRSEVASSNRWQRFLATNAANAVPIGTRNRAQPHPDRLRPYSSEEIATTNSPRSPGPTPMDTPG